MLKYCSYLLISLILVSGYAYAQSMNMGMGIDSTVILRVMTTTPASGCATNLQLDHQNACNAASVPIIGS